MLILFKLTMPGINTWNNQWTGQDKLYAKIINWDHRYGKSQKAIDMANEIIDKDFSYNFGDGWRAKISTQIIDSKQAAKIRSKSSGFMGYEWMIDSIIQNKKIMCD